MFRQLRPQAAVDEETGLLWGTLSRTKAHLKSGDKELILFWEEGLDDDKTPLSIVYLPAYLFWEGPAGHQAIGLAERARIKEDIQEAAKVLNYRVEFVDEAPLLV